MSFSQSTGMFVAETHTEAVTWFFTIEKMLLSGETQYQEYQICEVPNFGKSLFLDHNIQTSLLDEHVYHEAMSQPGMVTHPNPKKVAVCGGGEGSTLREALTHNTVEEAVMIDIDKELVDMVKEHMKEWHQGAFDDPRTTLLHEDARGYLEGQKGANFDVILSDLPNPHEDGPAVKLFTEEYFQICAEALSDDGVFVLQAGCANANYPYHFASCYKTLSEMKETYPIVRGYWAHVTSFMMPWGFILASKKHDPLALSEADIAQRFAQRGVKTRYYTPRFHQATFTIPDYLYEAVEEHGRVLTDDAPFYWTA
ncbi:MAG: fused MFS/spermidine synthase [Fimbriimonadales bacterium]